ncbi:MAG: tetratricopeptide repeat-containing protein kinase family protein, partial [Bacteroidota bacterium]
LVVHSDLKPSNVLVAAPNPDKPAQGEPKLLDFGVAQLVGTHSQGRPLTPQYASPEQVLGRPVTTASDVYSLGLVLYRLVTGSTPYKADATDWPALQRAICSPERLRASAHTPEPALYADTDVSRELRGDLDAILSKAVARQPAHRYASVDQLRSDLDAWLRGYPISAQPDALTYRAGLFMRRNRWGVGLAAAVFAFALIAAGVIGFQSRRLAVQLAEADAANRYMQSLFDISDPEQVGDSTITVRQLLDAGLEQAQATFGDRPERMSTVLNVLGPLYEKRGWYREAIRVNDLAVQQLETSGAADQMELASSYKFLASSHHAWGDYDEAEGLYRRALELLRGVLGPDDPRVADAMNDLALLLYDNGATDEAEVLTRRALATREQAAVPAQDVAESLNLLGLIVQAGGDEQAALAAYTRSLQLRRRTLGERHLKTAATMNNLALLHKEYGRLGEAEALMSQVLDIERAALGEAHPSVATSLNNYGRLLRSMGHLDEAERVYRDALAIRQEYFGSQHQAVATSLNNLAFLLQHKGQPAQAVPLYEQAIEAWHSASGATHPDVAVGHHNLARLLRDEQQFAEAQRHYERAAGIYERHLPETHVDLASVLVGLGKLHLLAGQPADAIPALRRAHELRRMHLGLDDWRPYSAQSLLGEAMHSVGGSSAGRSHLVAGYEGLRRVLGADDRRTQEAKARLRQ